MVWLTIVVVVVVQLSLGSLVTLFEFGVLKLLVKVLVETCLTGFLILMVP